MSLTIPDTNLILEKVSSTAEKWGPGAFCAVMIVGAVILAGFLAGPAVWEDYVAERTAKIASDRDISMARIEAESIARKLEREMQQSSIAAILQRQDKGNEQLRDINEILKKNNEDMSAGFAYTTKKLEEIATATAKMTRSGKPPNPMAEMNKDIIRPNFFLTPNPITPET